MPTFNVRRVRGVLLASCLGLLVGCIGGEIALRVLLFSDNAVARTLAGRLRAAGNFADGESDDDYWKLEYLFTDPKLRRPVPGFDPVLGWTGARITPRTYQPLRPCPDDGRQLVLMYGDSFTQCVTPESECFQTILQRSNLGADFCLVNYGVGGYGLDQMYLMLRESVDLYAGRDPIVVVGILVDSDLDRSILALRDWPKPRFVVQDDELVVREPVVQDTDVYLAEHPLEIRSYLLRFLVLGGGLLRPSARARVLFGDHERIPEKSALNRRILHEIHRELSSRNLRSFYVLFHMDDALRRSPAIAWQEQLVRDVCTELGTPVLSTRPYLLAAGCDDYETAARFYGRDPKLQGHHTALGNIVTFEAIRHGLEARFAPIDLSYMRAWIERDEFHCPPDLARSRVSRQVLLNYPAWVSARSDSACVRYGDAARLPGESDRLCLRAGEGGATEVTFELSGTARRLTGKARSFTLASADCTSGRVTLVIETDGTTRFRATHPIAADGIDVDVDLTGVERLKIMAAIEAGRPVCEWVCLGDAKLE